MDNYRHILLAADYSQDNANVAAKARILAEQHQARLSMIHVVDDVPLPDTGYGSVLPIHQETDNELLNSAKQRLQKLAHQYAIAEDSCWLVWGNPKQEIEAFAEKSDIDLIVLGFHAHRGLAGLFGSVADSVLGHAQCDVIVVRL